MHRRRYKNPFRAQVIDYLCRYDEIKEKGGCTALTIIGAIDRTIENIRKEQDGELMVQIISMMYLKKTHDVRGVEKECGMDRATVYRWVNRFVKKVCMEAGLMKSN